MREVWNWLVKNFSNLFTIIGIILTVYFSIYYVPDYIRNNEDERIKNINSDLIESVQETIYNKYDISQKQIETLIRGKEIKYKITYPFSANDLLIQTQESFMANKFVPLKERIEVIERIDSLRNTLKSNLATKAYKPKSKKESKDSKFWIILSATLGVLSALLGSISLFFRLWRDRQRSIEIEVEQEKDSIQSQIMNAINFEKSVKEILDKNEFVYEVFESSELGFDFVVKLSNEKDFPIVVKYITTGGALNMSSIQRLFYPFTRSNSVGVLILNKADNRMIHYLNKFTEEKEGKLYTIVSSDITEIEVSLLKYIKSNID